MSKINYGNNLPLSITYRGNEIFDDHYKIYYKEELKLSRNYLTYKRTYEGNKTNQVRYKLDKKNDKQYQEIFYTLTKALVEIDKRDFDQEFDLLTPSEITLQFQDKPPKSFKFYSNLYENNLDAIAYYLLEIIPDVLPHPKCLDKQEPFFETFKLDEEIFLTLKDELISGLLLIKNHNGNDKMILYDEAIVFYNQSDKNAPMYDIYYADKSATDILIKIEETFKRLLHKKINTLQTIDTQLINRFKNKDMTFAQNKMHIFNLGKYVDFIVDDKLLNLFGKEILKDGNFSWFINLLKYLIRHSDIDTRFFDFI